MDEKTDMQLLGEYVAEGSEAAFEAVVRRHLSLVCSAATRITQDQGMAEEVTQAVFVILSRKARSLPRSTILPAWLYRTAQFAAADAVKARRRRLRREQEANIMNTGNDCDPSWQRIAPLLDQAMARLSEVDRTAILLRFFENKSLREVGATLAVSDDTAQKRISRALEKLRNLLGKENSTLSAAGLAGLLSQQACQGTCTHSAEAICALATGASNASTAITTIVQGTIQIFMFTQLKKWAVVGLVILLTLGSITWLAKRSSTRPSHVEITRDVPVESLKALSQAISTHDSNAFVALVYAETDQGQALITATAELLHAQASFKQALAEKFTPPEATRLMSKVNFTAFQFGQSGLEAAETTIEGESATVAIPSRSNPGRKRSHRMVARGGGWRLDADAKNEHATPKTLAAFKAVAEAIQRTTQDVRSSKHATAAEAVEALKAQAIGAAMASN